MFSSKKDKEISQLKEKIKQLEYNLQHHARNTDELIAIEDINREFISQVKIEEYTISDNHAFCKDDKERVQEYAMALGFKTRTQDDGNLDLNGYVYRFAKLMFDLGTHRNSTDNYGVQRLDVWSLYSGLLTLGATPLITAICNHQRKLVSGLEHSDRALVLEFYSRNEQMFYYYEGRYVDFLSDYSKAVLSVGLTPEEAAMQIRFKVPENQRVSFIKLMRQVHSASK